MLGVNVWTQGNGWRTVLTLTRHKWSILCESSRVAPTPPADH